MKINQTITPKFNNNIDKNNDKSNVQFQGLGILADQGLRFLEASPAIGACFVDLGSMVIPRTCVDFTRQPADKPKGEKRTLNYAAGIETARREATSTVNHALIGVFGTVAGMALAGTLKNKFDINASKIYADNSTFNAHAQEYSKHMNLENPLEAYIKKTADDITVEGKALSKEAKELFINTMHNELTREGSPNVLSKDLEKSLRASLVSITGSENHYALQGYPKKPAASVSVFIKNFYNVSKTFLSEEVGNSLKAATNVHDSTFLKAFKSFNIGRAVLGLAIPSAIGMSIQPLNVYLTKKKTGSDGFVGVEGREKDKSSGFKVLKTIAAGIFGAGAILAIGNPKDLMKNIQFRGMMPSIPQFKFLYGMTIMSRFLVARDKDELRESCVKDTLGFMNWLVLGPFVSKGIAKIMDKKLDGTKLLYDTEKSKNALQKFFKASMRTRDEILLSGLKTLGIDVLGKDGKALKYSELYKLIPTNEAGKAIKAGVRRIGIAQVAGYAYSGLVLGFALPKLNIYMTNRSEAKRKAKLAEEKGQQPVEMTKKSDANTSFASNAAMLAPDNLEFLSKNM